MEGSECKTCETVEYNSFAKLEPANLDALVYPKYYILDLVRTNTINDSIDWTVVGLEYFDKDGFYYYLRNTIMGKGRFMVKESEITCVIQSYKEFIERNRNTNITKCQNPK